MRHANSLIKIHRSLPAPRILAPLCCGRCVRVFPLRLWLPILYPSGMCNRSLAVRPFRHTHNLSSYMETQHSLSLITYKA